MRDLGRGRGEAALQEDRAGRLKDVLVAYRGGA
jgi:hypothetical protein